MRLFRLDDAAPNPPQSIPASYGLSQNFPNPFNPTTRIHFDIKTEGWTRLTVHNILGERVAELVNGVQPPGSYEISFDGSCLASGVYFYRLESGGFTKFGKWF